VDAGTVANVGTVSGKDPEGSPVTTDDPASRDAINKDGELLEGSHSDKERYQENPFKKKQCRGVNDCNKENYSQASTRTTSTTTDCLPRGGGSDAKDDVEMKEPTEDLEYKQAMKEAKLASTRIVDQETRGFKETTTTTTNTFLRGLLNLGNTCYLNAALQLLFSVPGLMARLQKQGGKGGDLTRSVLLVNQTLADSKAAANPKYVKAVIEAKTDRFHGSQQEDAHEFLGALVENIHGEHQESKDNPMNEFCMTAKVSLTCCSCNYQR
jgi:hypothetical protein